jgi:hypothetical protein
MPYNKQTHRTGRWKAHEANTPPKAKRLGCKAAPPLDEAAAGDGDGKKLLAFSNMRKDAIFTYALRIISEEGIKDRLGLKKAEPGLFGALMRRCAKQPDLLERLGLTMNERQWDVMTDRELYAYAEKRADGLDRMNVVGLMDKDRELYTTLFQRRLLDKLARHIRIKAKAAPMQTTPPHAPAPGHTAEEAPTD